MEEMALPVGHLAEVHISHKLVEEVIKVFGRSLSLDSVCKYLECCRFSIALSGVL